MSPSLESRHDSAIDILRIIAVLAVILIHTTTRRLEAVSYNLTDFGFTLFLNQIARFGTPLFFMVSGFVLQLAYPEQMPFIHFVNKRLNKLFLPFLFWSLLYYYFVYRQHTHRFIQSLLTGDASYQLYFIPAIFILYLLFPLIRIFRQHIFNIPVMLLLGLVQAVLLYIDYYLEPLNYSAPVNAVLLNFYLFLIGIWTENHRQKILNLYQRHHKTIIFIAVGLGILIFFEGRSRFLTTQNYLSFYSQWRPSVLIYTLLIGWLFYGYFSSNQAAFKIGRIISPLVYFMFYAHVAVLEFIWDYFQPYYLIPGFDIFFFLLVSLFSAGLAFITRKIPSISRLTG